MRLHLAPCKLSRAIEFPQAVQNHLDPDDGEGEFHISDPMMGWISDDGLRAFLSCGPNFEVVSALSGERQAAWTFGAILKDPNTKVTCAAELPGFGEASNSSQSTQIIIGLDYGSLPAMVCVFDTTGSRITKAVQLPSKVTSIAVLNTSKTSCVLSYPIANELRHMYGIVALGLAGGHVLLMDLCKSEENTERSDELKYAKVMLTQPKDPQLELKKELSVKNRSHLCLLLNGSATEFNNFRFQARHNNILETFNTADVLVTALLYVPQLGSVIVGFSFGGFQIWNLMTLEIEYGSMKGDQPVTGFVFQEPEDDPRNFCYLWVNRSFTDGMETSTYAVITMYALCYQTKELIQGCGFLYQEFVSCTVRFEHQLGSEEGASGSRHISCHPIETQPHKRDMFNGLGQQDPDDYPVNSQRSLCMFVWESGKHESKHRSMKMALFDLNQWYKEQMPYQVDSSSSCYFAFYALEQIVGQAKENSLLDVRVVPSSLSRYSSVVSLEEHFYPTALSFESVSVLTKGILKVAHPGIQHKVLRDLHQMGAEALLYPNTLFHECLAVGLKSLHMEIINPSNTPVMEQREFLLSIALQHHLVSFLVKCAAVWASGSQGAVGCTLQTLVDWAWQQATAIKSHIDRICVPLFDFSGQKLDNNSYQLLAHCGNQLQHLATLFQYLKQQELPDIRQRCHVLQLLCGFVQVVIWFYNAGLLPEFEEDDTEVLDGCRMPYPVSDLVKSYQMRREKLQNLNSVVDVTEVLFIDGLMKECGPKLSSTWEREGGSGQYPPPTLHALLSMYLLEGINQETKHSIVHYLFLDLAALLCTDRFGALTNHLIQFPSAFSLSPSIIKLTQGFWLLDHKDFEVAVSVLLDPLISVDDIKPWQHRCIIRAFLFQGEHQKALRYVRVRQPPVRDLEDIRLNLTLLLANGMIHEAFSYQRRLRNDQNASALLQHFFLGCHQMKQLKTALQLSLSMVEEEALVEYLESCQDPKAQDVLLMYYLQRSRLVEALHVNEAMKCSKLSLESVLKCKDKFSVRDAIINGYSKTLPSVTQQLAAYCTQESVAAQKRKEVDRPVPMSVEVHHKSPLVKYKSSFVSAALEKTKEIWGKSSFTPFRTGGKRKRSFRSNVEELPFICTPVTPKSNSELGAVPAVVFPSATGPTAISAFTSEEELGGSPLKRTRYLELAPFKVVDSAPFKITDSVRRRLTRYSCVDVVSLLQTPHVRRKSFSSRGKQAESVDVMTPQSILKIRKMVQQAGSSESPQKSPSVTPLSSRASSLTPERDIAPREQVENASRQIRFSLPPTIETSSPESETSSPGKEESSSDNKLSPSKPVSVTPRRPLPRAAKSNLSFSETRTFKRRTIFEESIIENDNEYESQEIKNRERVPETSTTVEKRYEEVSGLRDEKADSVQTVRNEKDVPSFIFSTGTDEEEATEEFHSFEEQQVSKDDGRESSNEEEMDVEESKVDAEGFEQQIEKNDEDFEHQIEKDAEDFEHQIVKDAEDFEHRIGSEHPQERSEICEQIAEKTGYEYSEDTFKKLSDYNEDVDGYTITDLTNAVRETEHVVDDTRSVEKAKATEPSEIECIELTDSEPEGKEEPSQNSASDWSGDESEGSGKRSEDSYEEENEGEQEEEETEEEEEEVMVLSSEEDKETKDPNRMPEFEELDYEEEDLQDSMQGSKTGATSSESDEVEDGSLVRMRKDALMPGTFSELQTYNYIQGNKTSSESSESSDYEIQKGSDYNIQEVEAKEEYTFEEQLLPKVETEPKNDLEELEVAKPDQNVEETSNSDLCISSSRKEASSDGNISQDIAHSQMEYQIGHTVENMTLSEVFALVTDKKYDKGIEMYSATRTVSNLEYEVIGEAVLQDVIEAVTKPEIEETEPIRVSESVHDSESSGNSSESNVEASNQSSVKSVADTQGMVVDVESAQHTNESDKEMAVSVAETAEQESPVREKELDARLEVEKSIENRSPDSQIHPDDLKLSADQEKDLGTGMEIEERTENSCEERTENSCPDDAKLSPVRVKESDPRMEIEKSTENSDPDDAKLSPVQERDWETGMETEKRSESSYPDGAKLSPVREKESDTRMEIKKSIENRTPDRQSYPDDSKLSSVQEKESVTRTDAEKSVEIKTPDSQSYLDDLKLDWSSSDESVEKPQSVASVKSDTKNESEPSHRLTRSTARGSNLKLEDLEKASVGTSEHVEDDRRERMSVASSRSTRSNRRSIQLQAEANERVGKGAEEIGTPKSKGRQSVAPETRELRSRSVEVSKKDDDEKSDARLSGAESSYSATSSRKGRRRSSTGVKGRRDSNTGEGNTMIVDEEKESKESMVSEAVESYAGTRRLTRSQKTLLSKSISLMGQTLESTAGTPGADDGKLSPTNSEVSTSSVRTPSRRSLRLKGNKGHDKTDHSPQSDTSTAISLTPDYSVHSAPGGDAVGKKVPHKKTLSVGSLRRSKRLSGEFSPGRASTLSTASDFDSPRSVSSRQSIGTHDSEDSISMRTRSQAIINTESTSEQFEERSSLPDAESQLPKANTKVIPRRSTRRRSHGVGELVPIPEQDMDVEEEEGTKVAEKPVTRGPVFAFSPPTKVEKDETSKGPEVNVLPFVFSPPHTRSPVQKRPQRRSVLTSQSLQPIVEEAHQHSSKDSGSGGEFVSLSYISKSLRSKDAQRTSSTRSSISDSLLSFDTKAESSEYGRSRRNRERRSSSMSSGGDRRRHSAFKSRESYRLDFNS